MGTAAASAGAAGPSEGLRAGRSSGRTKPGVHRAERTTRPRGLRERADASVRRPGLGARLLATSDEARAGYDLQFRQRFFLSDNQRVAVLDWRIRIACASFLAAEDSSRIDVADLNCNKRDSGFGRIFRSYPHSVVAYTLTLQQQRRSPRGHLQAR